MQDCGHSGHLSLDAVAAASTLILPPLAVLTLTLHPPASESNAAALSWASRGKGKLLCTSACNLPQGQRTAPKLVHARWKLSPRAGGGAICLRPRSSLTSFTA